MCEKKKQGCCKPDKLKGGKPEACSPEQIRACHGDGKGHPCTDAKPKQS